MPRFLMQTREAQVTACPRGHVAATGREVIGTGTGALPVMKEVKREAVRRKIKLLVMPVK
jgi:hypothetical protein